MNCARIRKLIVTADLGGLPPEVVAHVETCPACAELRERTTTVVRLVALKRYETPDPFAAERCLRRFRDRATPEAAGAHRGLGLLGLPTAATGVAVLLLTVVGIQLQSPTDLPALHAPINNAHMRSLEEFWADQTAGSQPYFTFIPTDDLSSTNNLAIPNNRAIPRAMNTESVFFVTD